MVTMRWLAASPEDGAKIARDVSNIVIGSLVWWNDLPLWQATFHVQCKKLGDGAVVMLRLWPEPEGPVG